MKLMTALVLMMMLVSHVTPAKRGVLNKLTSDLNVLTNDLVGAFDRLIPQVSISDTLFGNIVGDKRAFLFSDVRTSDIHLDVPQLLKQNGYPSETYVVETEDGYLITIHRIPHGKIKPATPSRDVVVLFRGIFSNTYEYLFLGPGRALGYTLADKGYDVWMVEMRGNSYSKAHVKYQPDSSHFWNMDWDEMGTYDVPAAVNFVLNKTGVDKVYVGGHSMGTTALFVGLSVHPWLNEKIRLAIALGPVAFTTHMGGPLGIIGHQVALTTWDDVAAQSLNPVTVIDLLQLLRKTVCDTQQHLNLCGLVQSYVEFYSFGNFSDTAFPTLINHFPETDSIKTVTHYLQGVQTGKFQRFDYGAVENKERYGRRGPPQYDLSQVTAPVALFGSDADFYANPQDLRKLASKLPNVAVLKMTKDKTFTHIDFAYGNSAPEQVYQHIYIVMERY